MASTYQPTRAAVRRAARTIVAAHALRANAAAIAAACRDAPAATTILAMVGEDGTLDVLYWLSDGEVPARSAALDSGEWTVLFRPGDAEPRVVAVADRIGRLAAARYCALCHIRMRGR
jgi:hypothetical protein